MRLLCVSCVLCLCLCVYMFVSLFVLFVSMCLLIGLCKYQCTAGTMPITTSLAKYAPAHPPSPSAHTALQSCKFCTFENLHIWKLCTFAHLKILHTVDCTKHKISFAECAQIAQFDNAVEEQEEPSMCDSMRSYCHLNGQCNMQRGTHLLRSLHWFVKNLRLRNKLAARGK